ncbi:chemotaxis protein CheA [Halovulum dunhuangense]|uniref:Chemotaxis protein CheA n=1 Tax=Halovulum dunhuangense TaxID=1505036 RepID=A0A849KYF7_9RHOB|nr:chemotaxis protein CheA [Halovulum dunhuangense]NNU79186.1 chemotaxis protein CheA [Halovulum dunhuangense]
MDEDEDFEALFFSEAKELLEALIEHLNLLAADAGDPDTVHAAFRAVHSVKGGAAAFGFEQLIGFAHQFETVMDLVRSGSLPLDAELCALLLRSGDMMQTLVEMAEAGDTGPAPGMQRLQSDLAARAGLSDAPKPAPEIPDACALPPPTLREVEIRFTPDAGFFESGHDMLRLVRAAREHGLAEVHATGTLPPIATFDPRLCPLGWDLMFRTDRPDDALTAFFAIYEHTARVEFAGLADEPEQVAPEAPPPLASAEEAAPSSGPAGAVGTEAATPGSPTRGDSGKSLRVDIVRIDRLVNLVGEMLITQAALAQNLFEGGEGRSLADIAHTVDAMSRQLRELQESVMAIRAQPVRSVFRRMPRVVRDLADKLGKNARLDLEGEATEVDATVIEELAEPLTHMIRNAMDHGLEAAEERLALGKSGTGRIRLAAEHRGERVIITVEDDGRGVNRERVLAKALERGLVGPDDRLSPEEIDMLIFHPGFSTAEEISSVSGRGVGMDVVKKKILSLGGRFSMVSTPGRGTRFDITLPLTLAVMDGMTISVGDQKFILPLSEVIEALHVTAGSGKRLPDGSSLLERRGEYLRLVSLRDALSMPPSDTDGQMAIVVDTETSGPVALIVDELIGQRQIVLKSLEANFRKVEGVSGATILGDGQVALILDIARLLQLQGPGSGPREVFH